MLEHQDIGITPESFRENLDALEEAGFTLPPEDTWPPLYHELPYEAQEAIRLFYILPNKIDGMAGYTGKELASYTMFCDIFEVPGESRKIILEIILHLINKSIESVNKKSKAASKSK
jgi:hypothetical protein